MGLAVANNLPANRTLNKQTTLPPHELAWSALSTPVAGTQASIVIPASTAGNAHVLTAYAVNIAAIAAPAATLLTLQILDGATVIWQEVIAVQAAVGTQRLTMSGLCLVGSVNTSMTIQISAGLASTTESISVNGYDIIN
jgi:hypothetical protein